MTNTIAGSRLSVTVNRHGAELAGLKGADGVEYLWQGDPAVWGRRAPLLFPIVGRLALDRYDHEGKTYEMKQHGFARDLDFELAQATETALRYRLRPSEATRRQYPFEFVLSREYVLADDVLTVVTTVTNAGGTVMPFSIGEHPGFSLAWGAGDQIEDYYLEFGETETLDSVLLDSDGLLSSRTVRVLTGERILPLHRDLFARDALIFLRLNSSRITLASRRHARRLTVEFAGYPCLGIWAKPGAPFVCIEPWYGHADTSNHDGYLVHKPGIIKLQPGCTFTCQWQVKVSA